MCDPICKVECVDETCDPIHTVKDLIEFEAFRTGWCSLVEPLKSRASPRILGENYHKFFESDKSADDYDEETRPQILICHDYKGNYLSDKFVNGATNWEEYRFYNWSCVDIFCYFSHNFVTIPTLQFINAAHRHGVKIIGTFIVEGNDGMKIMNNQILTTEENVTKIAEKLANLCKSFNFEGWLLNIECQILKSKIPLLKQFVKQVTELTHEAVPRSQVIWYDSVIETGNLNWQNELNSSNVAFFELSDGIFLNYGWRSGHVNRTDEFIKTKYPNRRKDVFFGIDIFQRGQVAGFRTNETHSQVVEKNFSTALFAVGWTHEKITYKEKPDVSPEVRSADINHLFIERNDKFWNLLWKNLPTFGPSELPFSTTFCLGSGCQKSILGKIINSSSWFNLRYQKFQLSVPTSQSILTHNFTDSFHGGSSINLETKEAIRLFVCDFKCDSDLILIYAYKKESPDVNIRMLLKLLNQVSKESKVLVCGYSEDNEDNLIKCQEIESTDHLKKVHIELPKSSDSLNLGRNSINDWTIKYFLIKSDPEFHITDIGIQKSSDNKVILGGLSIYKLPEDFKLSD